MADPRRLSWSMPSVCQCAALGFGQDLDGLAVGIAKVVEGGFPIAQGKCAAEQRLDLDDALG